MLKVSIRQASSFVGCMCCIAIFAGADCENGMPMGGGGTTPRTLFVVSPNTNLLTFANPGALNGAGVTPTTELELGLGGQIVSPKDAIVTPAGILIVANSAGISIFENAFTATGPRAADRIVEGAESGISTPVDVAYDAENDILFVSEDATSNEILVFDNVSNLAFDGDVQPSRTIGTNDNAFDAEQMRFFGGALYVVSRENVLIFENASTLDTSDFTADRLFTSPMIDEPGISIDSMGRLIVANEDDSVRIWNDASTVDGSPAPDLELTIQDAVRIDSAVIDANDRMYAADRTRNLIYTIDNVSQLSSGTVQADRVNEADELQTPERLFLFEE